MFQVEQLFSLLGTVYKKEFIDEFDNMEDAIECAKKHGSCRIIMVVWGSRK